MKAERWQQIDQVLQAALGCEGEQRQAYLDQACAGDEALRREVESLLLAHQEAGSFIEAHVSQVAAELMAEEKVQAEAGRVIAHYRVVKELGTGGMGEVYLAYDTRLGREVALKLLPEFFTRDAGRVRRFEQEARAASCLNHPNILTIYEFGQADGTRFIATEYIDGESLRQRIGRAVLGVRAVLEVGIQIASALAAAHGAGIVHRDIKPENIMVRRDGILKVLDFGLAKLTESPVGVVDTGAPTKPQINTEPGVVMGSTNYMSPEQARGLEVDERTDIFSLGVVLYEMLAGRMPFVGKTSSDVIAAILTTEPASPSSFNQETPAELERIVSKTLAKDRAERYQTAKDLLVDLRRLQKQIEIQAEIERTVPPNRTRSGNGTQALAARPTSSAEYVAGEIRKHKLGFAVALALLSLTAVGLGYRFFASRAPHAAPIESIAVLPFQNASGNPDVEYLSDGMSESLINNLSQLPSLSVKARSTVFRYKGQDALPQTIAAELSVQAVLSGRVVQRGDDLTLYLSLVDGRNGDQLWGEQYSRKLTDLVALQSEIARDVSQKLRARLSGAEEQRLAKNYTENAEAYQLYLKGRYHVAKLTGPEIQKGVSYYQQAIAIDPTYALAYVGLADAYRALAQAVEMLPTQSFPKAKAAAQKAIEIDDRLAEAHAVLGFIKFWYDWDWKGAENQCRRALELNPKSAYAHMAYAQLLSFTGRRAEALAEAKRAIELDQLDLRINVLEGQSLVLAGRPDEALARLQKTLELDPNYWLAHSWSSSAYIEKGMFAEAVAEGRKAKELFGGNSNAMVYLGYALAKWGKRVEARDVLEETLKLSAEHYVSPYNIALIYHGLGERDQALAWLERGFEQRDPKMVFLKVERKWDDLRDDPRFRDLLRRVGFPS